MMFDSIISILKTILVGFVVIIVLTVTAINGAWESANEQDISADQVEVTDISYEVSDYATTSEQVSVSANINNLSDLDITDYTLQLKVYDCPTLDSDFSNCELIVERETSPWLDIPAGTIDNQHHSFRIGEKNQTTGYQVFDIQFLNFQGSQPQE